MTYSQNPLTVDEMLEIREVLERLAPYAPPRSALSREADNALYALDDAIERRRCEVV